MRHETEEARGNIGRWVSNIKNKGPLRFIGYNDKVMCLTKTKDNVALVIEILQFASQYESYGSDGYETRRGAMRSAFDIWRHAKTVKPGIGIFSIMEAIYKADGTKVYGHYCGDVERSVFMIYPYSHGMRWRKDFYCREYSIHFRDWIKLH